MALPFVLHTACVPDRVLIGFALVVIRGPTSFGSLVPRQLSGALYWTVFVVEYFTQFFFLFFDIYDDSSV